MTAPMRRRMLVALVSAVITSALAVAINLATSWMRSVWAWVAAATLTLAAAGIAFLLDRESPKDSETRNPPINQIVNNSSVNGSVIQIAHTDGNVEIQ